MNTIKYITDNVIMDSKGNLYTTNLDEWGVLYLSAFIRDINRFYIQKRKLYVKNLDPNTKLKGSLAKIQIRKN